MGFSKTKQKQKNATMTEKTTELKTPLLVQNEPERVVVVEGEPVVAGANNSAKKTAAAPKATAVVGRSPPPPGVEPGGVWGTYKYLGGTSGAVACLGCLCFGLPALLVLLCPLDKRDAYKVNNRIYDPEGRYLGKATSKFSAKMDRYGN